MNAWLAEVGKWHAVFWAGRRDADDPIRSAGGLEDEALGRLARRLAAAPDAMDETSELSLPQWVFLVAWPPLVLGVERKSAMRRWDADDASARAAYGA